MPGSISDYLEDKLIDHVLKNTAYTVPSNLYIGLSTADPTDDGSGNAEPSGDGYVRVLCNSWATASSRVTSNAAAVEFPDAEGSGWGTITHWTIWDASSGGNLIAHCPLTTPRVVGTGIILRAEIGDLTVTVLTGGMSTYLANELLDHVFKVGSYSVPTNIYAALSTANPTDSGGSIAEPSGNNYSRVNMNDWDASSGGASSNGTAITFPTASGSWGTLTHGALFDASTSGNMLFYGALNVSQAVATGNVIAHAIGAWDVSIA